MVICASICVHMSECVNMHMQIFVFMFRRLSVVAPSGLSVKLDKAWLISVRARQLGSVPFRYLSHSPTVPSWYHGI